MNYTFKKATQADLPQIWVIIQNAILRRKEEGSQQWQDGYPNKDVLKNDIEKEIGFVLLDGETVVVYSAVLINDEPQYAKLLGKWLTDTDFVVFHRVAVASNYLGKGNAKLMIKHIFDFAQSNNIYSVKADTNFDNIAMTITFEKLGFEYCGKVSFRGSERNAYEKVLQKMV